MTQEQEDAAIGRLFREKYELEQKLNILQVEALRLGRLLSDLGNRLSTNPEQVIFENQEISLRFNVTNQPSFKADDVDGKRLIRLTSDIRDTIAKLQDIKQKGAPFGI